MVKLPPRSPNLNAYAERAVLSIKAKAWTTSSSSVKNTCGIWFASISNIIISSDLISRRITCRSQWPSRRPLINGWGRTTLSAASGSVACSNTSNAKRRNFAADLFVGHRGCAVANFFRHTYCLDSSPWLRLTTQSIPAFGHHRLVSCPLNSASFNKLVLDIVFVQDTLGLRPPLREAAPSAEFNYYHHPHRSIESQYAPR